MTHIRLKDNVVDGLNAIVGWGARLKQLEAAIGIRNTALDHALHGECITQRTAEKVAKALSSTGNELGWKDITEVYYD